MQTKRETKKSSAQFVYKVPAKKPGRKSNKSGEELLARAMKSKAK